MTHYIGMSVPISPQILRSHVGQLCTLSSEPTQTSLSVPKDVILCRYLPPQVYIRLFTCNAAQMPVSMQSLSHQVPLSDRVGVLPFTSLVYALCTILEGVVSGRVSSAAAPLGLGPIYLQSCVVTTQGLGNQIRLDEILSLLGTEVKLESLP